MWLWWIACAVSPGPVEAPREVSPTWAPLQLPLEGVEIVLDQPDSLLVRAPEEQLSVPEWTAAITAQGWQPDDESIGRRGLHAVRYLRGSPPTEALVFGATRYEGWSQHSLTVVEVP